MLGSAVIARNEPFSLIESLLHGWEWQNYRFFSISTDIYVGGFAGYAYYLKIDAIQLNIFAHRIFTPYWKVFRKRALR